MYIYICQYKYFRRGNERRGDRRDMDHRKNAQDDGHDRNVRERDQSKGRQSQFRDDYSGICGCFICMQYNSLAFHKMFTEEYRKN